MSGSEHVLNVSIVSLQDYFTAFFLLPGTQIFVGVAERFILEGNVKYIQKSEHPPRNHLSASSGIPRVYDSRKLIRNISTRCLK